MLLLVIFLVGGNLVRSPEISVPMKFRAGHKLSVESENPDDVLLCDIQTSLLDSLDLF